MNTRNNNRSRSNRTSRAPSPRSAEQSVLEGLEPRRMFAATTLTGTAGTDTWTITNLAAADMIVIDGQGGADRVIFGSGSLATNVMGKVVLKNYNGGTFQIDVNNGSGGGTRAVEIGHGLIKGALGTGGVVDYTQSPLSKLTVGVGGTGTANVYDTVAPTYVGLNGQYKTVAGDVGNLANVKHPLTLSNGYGPSTAVLSGLFSTSARTVYVDGNVVTGLAPAPITVQGYTTLGLNTGSYNDTVNVRSHLGTLSISTWGGSDTVNFGKNGSIGGLLGTITVGNITGTSHVKLDDSASTIARKVDIVDGTIYLAGKFSIKLGVANLTYKGGFGNDTFTVDWRRMQNLSLLGGGGSDSFDLKRCDGFLNVAGQDGGDSIRAGQWQLNQLRNSTLSGGAGYDFLTFNDQAETLSRSYRLGATMLQSNHTAVFTYDSEYVALFAGSGSDYIDAGWNTAPAALFGGAGNDTVVGGLARDTLYGGNGNDRLVGNASTDSLYGEMGNDTLVGGDGSGGDVLDGGNAFDYDTLRHDQGDVLTHGEQYILTAAVKGRVFNDANGNKVQDTGEIGLAQLAVFADFNNDGSRGSNEPIVFTDAYGNYAIGDLPVGLNRLVVTKPAGWIVTNGQTQTVTLATGQVKTGLNFGEKKI